MSTTCVEKECHKFTKDSSLIDESLNLIMFGKWKAYFNPLVDGVATQGISNTRNEKTARSSSYSGHMNNVFHGGNL